MPFFLPLLELFTPEMSKVAFEVGKDIAIGTAGGLTANALWKID